MLYAGSTAAPHLDDRAAPSRRLPRGPADPGAPPCARHEYPISLGVFRALAGTMPEVVVVSGWSTPASQAATAWCRLHHVPYVLLVESNERDPRPGWRRAVKAVVVPPIVRGAAEVLVVGRLARESMLTRGVLPERISLFADTVDAAEFGAEADRPCTATTCGPTRLAPEDVAVLSIARLAPEKAPDTLVRAVAAAADPRLVLVLAARGASGGGWTRSPRSWASAPCSRRTSPGRASSSGSRSPTSSRSSPVTSRGASS